jgi:hypothetical protein
MACVKNLRQALNDWSVDMLTALPLTARVSPKDFSAVLLRAVESDATCDPQSRAQHAALLEPFVNTDTEPMRFEAAISECWKRNTDLASTARDVWVLWKLCSA